VPYCGLEMEGHRGRRKRNNGFNFRRVR